MHVLGPWLLAWPEGYRPFGHLTSRTARDTMKTQLAGLGVADAGGYWLHDFRRGHTQDLLTKGATLAVILRAGEWISPAFMSYPDMQGLEKAAVVETHQVESDSDSD